MLSDTDQHPFERGEYSRYTACAVHEGALSRMGDYEREFDVAAACTDCVAQVVCEWYALCNRPAAGGVVHPVLGGVSTCRRCATKHGMEFDRVYPGAVDVQAATR